MPYFTNELFGFLGDLADNNDREWFEAQRDRYEATVVQPAFRFIDAIRPKLHEISPRFLAVAKKQGGSMFRIHRDTRFSKDKTPYKTHVGLQFRHEQASRDVHAPGFYLHLEPGNVGVGVGMWHPQSSALHAIRTRVDTDRQGWGAVRKAIDKAGFSFMGESLKRPPRGFDKDHEYIDDLKRKDWAVHQTLADDAALADDFVDSVATTFTAAAPLVRFLCETQDLAF